MDATLKHSAGHALNKTSPLLWTELSEEELSRVREEQLALEKDHVLTKRVQHWVDAIDSEMRKVNPGAYERVPRPVALVGQDWSKNAFVDAVPLCIPTNVKNETAAGDGNTFGFFAMALENSGLISAVREDRCFMRPELKFKLPQIVDLVNSNIIEDCRAVLENGGIAFKGTECRDGTLGTKTTKYFAFYAQPNYLVVSSSMPDVFSSEHQFVTVVAHEMAHYYKAHTTISNKDYNYFYKIENRVYGTKPEKEPTLKKLGEKITAIQWYNVTEYPGQKYPSPFYPLIADLNTTVTHSRGSFLTEYLRPVCSEGTACAQTCGPYFDEISGGGVSLYVPLDDLVDMAFFSPQKQEQLEALAEQFETCAKSIPLGDSDNAKVPQKFVEKFFGYEVFEPLFDEPVPNFENLAGVVNELALRFRKSRIIASRLYNEASERRLGFYTMEQEADEVTLEMISKVGIHPKRASEAFIALGFAHQKKNPGTYDKLFNAIVLDITPEQCKFYYHRDWTGVDGNPLVFVPVGNYGEEHHSTCFRAHNLWQEARHHKYEIKNKKVYDIAEPSWPKIQALGRSVSGEQ